MPGRSGRRVLAAAIVAVVAAVSFACGSDDEDCDSEDLAGREAECGYYTDDGAFVLYPWVIPGIGGHPPKGSHPKPPAGTKPGGTKPKPVKPAKPAGAQ